MTCGECGNVTAPGAGFPNHVYCKRFLLHMGKREDASRCRDFIPKPQTNADRIRSMTDGELATIIAWPYIAPPEWCANHPTCPFISEDPTPCDKCALEWLQQEVESNDS